MSNRKSWYTRVIDLLTLISTGGSAPTAVQQGGLFDQAPSTFSRPANVTPYTAGDSVSSSIDAGTPAIALHCAPALGGTQQWHGYLTKLRLLTNKTGIAPVFRVHLFYTNVSMQGDNLAYSDLFADKTSKLGEVTLPAMSSLGGSGSDYVGAETENLRKSLGLWPGGATLYAWLETTTAFTPNSGQQFSLVANVDWYPAREQLV